MADNKQIAADVLDAVGGSKNVSYVSHCMTRLRFNLKDKSIADTAQIKKIKGVAGAQEVGGQLQVIIGTNVEGVYDELCALGGLAKQEAIDENLDAPEEKLTPKKLLDNTLNYLAGSMTPMIPLLLTGGLFKCLGVVLGSDVLGLFADDSDFITLTTIVYNAVFYFLPIFLGYNAAKVIGITPLVGALFGAILLEPTFVSMVEEGGSFTVYGINAPLNSYEQTVLPVLLTVWAAYYVDKLFHRFIPEVLGTFIPFFTVVVMLPISLCLLAPLGSWIGNLIAAVFTWIGEKGGVLKVIGVALIAGLWTPLVISGMHMTLGMTAMTAFYTVGYDSFILVGANVANGALIAMMLVCMIKLRNREEKQAAGAYLAAKALGGVAEPFLYGMVLRYDRLLVCLIASSAVSGLVAGILNVSIYVIGLPGNLFDLLGILGFVGGGTSNLVGAVIAVLAGFIAGFVITWLFGFTEDELENGPASERA